MKKRLCLALAAALSLSMLLTGCEAKPIPDSMDETQVTDAAQVIVEQLLNEEYQAVADAFRADLKTEYNVTAQTIEEMMERIEKAGEFVATDEILVRGGRNKDFKEPYAAVTIYCEHEKDDVVYDMSLDENLALLGLAVDKK